MAARKLTGLSSKRTLLPVDDVPQADTRFSQETRTWVTPGAVITWSIGGIILLLALIAAFVLLAQTDQLDEVGDFLSRDIPILKAIGAFLLGLAGYLKLRSVGFEARRSADAANNAEAHVGKLLPARIDERLGGLETLLRDRTEVLQHMPAEEQSVSVVPASSPADAGFPAVPSHPAPEPESAHDPEPLRRRAPAEVVASTQAPFAYTRTGSIPAVADPGATQQWMPWETPEERR